MYAHYISRHSNEKGRAALKRDINRRTLEERMASHRWEAARG